jgi:large subunit ribosomal protein L15
MNLQSLPKLVKRSAKRVGRGVGSGKGSHTTGRGNKGQKAREDVKIYFEGTKMKKSLIKRLPFQRGKNKMKSLTPSPVVLTLNTLEEFKGTEVTVSALLKQGLIKKDALVRGIKVVGDGTLKQALVFKIPVSQSAAAKITKAGGKIEL